MSSKAKTILATVVGAAGGYAFYHFIGCHASTWGIVGNPVFSTLFGAIIGYTIGGADRPGRPEEEKEEKVDET